MSHNPEDIVFRNAKITPLEKVSNYLARMFSKVNSGQSEADLIFRTSNPISEQDQLDSLVFTDSSVPSISYLEQRQIDSLNWTDSSSTDFNTNSVLVNFLGQNLDLKKQNDTNQCGVCAIFNTLEILGINHNWSVLGIRQWVLQDQLRKNFAKIENGQYFVKDGHGNYTNSPIDVNKFWLGQSDIENFLKMILTNSNFAIDIWFLINNCSIEDCEIIIFNTGNHFVVCFQKDGNWYKIDSLQSPENLLTKLDQNPLTIPHRPKTFLKRDYKLNFT